LTLGLRYALSSSDYPTFQKIVDKAYTMERERQVLDEDRKRKMSAQGQSSGSNTRPHFNQNPSGPVYSQGGQYQQKRNHYQYQQPQRNSYQYQPQPQRNVNQSQGPVRQPTQQPQQQHTGYQVPQPPIQNPQQQNRTGQGSSNIGPCYNCKEMGHLANRCPNKKAQGPNQQPPRQNYMQGRVNHVTAESAQDAPNVVFGMFSVHSNHATVLFDSGASHCFISTQFIHRYNVPIIWMKNKMIVNSPGGDMVARQVCPNVNINIRG